MKKKLWKIAPAQPEQAALLQRELGLSPLAASALAARGIWGRQAQDFLDTSLSRLGDPFLLPDMDKAAAEIRRALAAGDKIAVYGDYDVDGVTGAALLMRYLRAQGADCVYYIPDRLSEGYGLNQAAVRRLAEEGCRLMITVDSGITAIAEIEYAVGLGMNVIVTDHHECMDRLPPALAVINPRRPDSPYPFRELAGVGVAFKLICALERDRPLEELMAQYADIVAIGTVADVMPLVGENRTIVAQGLGLLEHTGNQGLRMLMQKLGLDPAAVSANAVGFTMAPRINAAGRMGGAGQAAELFLTEDPRQAMALAEELCELNRRRQQEENDIFQQIVGRLDGQFDPKQDKALVLWGENWHNGVIGIVASRLADRYGVPAVLISLDGQMGKGSGRSVPGFNLYAALEHCGELLEKYGGHELAAGLTVRRENLEEFRRRLAEYAAQRLDQDQIQPFISVDCLTQPDQLTLASVQSLSALEPFGMGNPQPVFCMREMTVEEITPISQDRHIKLQLSKEGQSFFAFLFGVGSANCPFLCGDQIDAAFSAEINRYRGRQSVQLVLKDAVWSQQEDARDQQDLALYQHFCQGRPISPDQALALRPVRDDLVAVFRHIKARARQGRLRVLPRSLYRQVRYESARPMNLGKLLVCLDIFQEFDIFDCAPAGEEMDITVLNRQGKADINGSKILKRLAEAGKSEG